MSQTTITPKSVGGPLKRRRMVLACIAGILILSGGVWFWKREELIRAMDPRRLAPVRTITIDLHEFGQSDVAIDGNQILVGDSGAQAAYLYDSNTGSLLRTFQIPEWGTDYGLSVSITGKHAFVGTQGKASYRGAKSEPAIVYQFDTFTGKLVRTYEPLQSDKTPTEFVDLGYYLVGSHGNKLVLSSLGGKSATINIFDVENGRLLFTIPPPMNNQTISDISISENKLAVLSRDLFVFDYNTGLLLQRSKPALAGVARITIGDGKAVASNVLGSLTGEPDFHPEVALLDTADGSLIRKVPSPRRAAAPDRPVEVSFYGIRTWLHGNKVLIFEPLEWPEPDMSYPPKPRPSKRKRVKEEDQILHIFDASTGELVNYIDAPIRDFRASYSFALSGRNLVMLIHGQHTTGFGGPKFSDCLYLHTLPEPKE